MKYSLSFLVIVIASWLNACNQPDHPATQSEATETEVNVQNLHLNLIQANRLASLPMKCLQTEYPNKTGQVLSKPSDLGSPKALHPAFYGCFDWHSAVHGHWSLVKLLKDFPELQHKEKILSQLKENISAENISQEIAYFNRTQEYSYERMYGWAWLLQLQMELDTWDTEDGKQLAAHLQPLTDLLISRYLEFLPKLLYPLRVGMHTNSAFGMIFAYDYASHSQNQPLISAIKENALRLYRNDKGCPLNWEPDGFDFLSPCLEEASLMQRVMPEKEFLQWLKEFLPTLADKNFSMGVAKVSDRADGHLVHLDGLNFSRAWVFYQLAKQFPQQYGHLLKEADKHLAYSLPAITDGGYEGEHWLASFALYALNERPE